MRLLVTIETARDTAPGQQATSGHDVVLDYAPLGEHGGERRSMAVVVRKDLFNAIQAMCLAAGMNDFLS